jgi:hypothetical protein
MFRSRLLPADNIMCDPAKVIFGDPSFRKRHAEVDPEREMSNS